MTVVTMDSDNGWYEISIKGHAEYSPGEPDIVCASCSTLACLLEQYVRTWMKDSWAYDAEILNESGNVHMRFGADVACSETIAQVVGVIQTGYVMLAAEYPEHVKIMG